MRGATGVAVLMLAILVCACGGSAETATDTAANAGAVQNETAATTAAQQTDLTPSTEAGRNPCAALSDAEASALVGLQVAAHAGDTENDCSYRTADDHVKLVVKKVDAAGFDAVAAMDGAQSVSGLGDRATWNDLFSSLLVVKGDRMLDVAYDESPEVATRATAEEKKQRAIALAEKLVPTI